MANSADPDQLASSEAISWLLQRPTDLDLHYFQKQGISGFSRTRVNTIYTLGKKFKFLNTESLFVNKLI